MALGERMPMVDAVPRVTGSIEYVLNLELPGMLHARVLRSQRADALGAVVLTRDDFGPETPVEPTFGLFARDQAVVALDKVRHVGDPVAAVAADDESTAAEALELIEVE